MVQQLKHHLTQWGAILMPYFLTIILGMSSYSVYQLNKSIDTKADQKAFDATCRDIDNRIDSINANVSSKVSNETLLRVIQILEQKDKYLEKTDERQDKMIEKGQAMQAKQLDVLQQINIKIERLSLVKE